jgi:SAM-dependent methyltransferase
MISARHSNRKLHNWLIYDINDRLLERFSAYYRGRLLDLGAGEAVYRDFFLDHADEYIALDWTSSYHDTKVDVVVDLNRPLPLASGVADTVVSISVLEHLCEPGTMIAEAFRILKPGGSLVLQVPWQWWIHEAPHDYFRYTPFGLNYLLSKAGFEGIQIHPLAGFFTTAVLKFNYFTNRFVGGPRVVQWLARLLLVPVWYLGQIAAKPLDKLDKSWEKESPGYFVVAHKP